MPTTFNALEREKMGALVNNLSVFAAQLLTRNNSDLTTRALANLAKIRREQTDLLKRVDKLAREQNEERPLRLIEDLVSVPTDIAQVIQGLIVLFVAAPPLIRAVFRLRQARVSGLEAAAKGWNG